MWVKSYLSLYQELPHRWFASVSVEVQPPIHRCPAASEFVDGFASQVEVGTPHQIEGSIYPAIGIDVGISTLATLDDGTKYENPKPLKRYARKLAREQRKLSRKVFLSKNWYKQKRIVERLHYRITCIRKDAHHKTTTDVLIGVSRVSVETLQVTNLLKNRKLAKVLSDAAFKRFP